MDMDIEYSRIVISKLIIVNIGNFVIIFLVFEPRGGGDSYYKYLKL